MTLWHKWILYCVLNSGGLPDGISLDLTTFCLETCDRMDVEEEYSILSSSMNVFNIQYFLHSNKKVIFRTAKCDACTC